MMRIRARLLVAAVLGSAVLVAPAQARSGQQTPPPTTPPGQQTPPPTTPPPTTPPQTPPVGQVPPVSTPPVQGTPLEPARQIPDVPPPTVSFEEWLSELRVEARTKGISDSTFDAAFANIQPDEKVIALDRKQPELTLTLDEYIAQRVTDKKVATARDVAKTYRALLTKVEAAYGVSAPVMVAIWGAESNFGKITGSYQTVGALATLAYDGRRPATFRRELFEALRMIEKGLVTVDEFKGSWAGAIGQPQFMPSSFLKYATDFDNDGHVNLWTSEPDVLASMAHKLNADGWNKGERWGREVSISESVMAAIDAEIPRRTAGCLSVKDMTVPKPLSAWKKIGVKNLGGGALPVAAMDASLVRGAQRNFLVYHNYEVLLSYNCSNAYAIGLGLLADAIAAKPTGK